MNRRSGVAALLLAIALSVGTASVGFAATRNAGRDSAVTESPNVPDVFTDYKGEILIAGGIVVFFGLLVVLRLVKKPPD